MIAVEQLLTYFDILPLFSNTAPNTLSSRLPTMPMANGIRSIQSRVSVMTPHPRIAISRDATVDDAVPRRDTPPLIPGSTLSPVVIM